MRKTILIILCVAILFGFGGVILLRHIMQHVFGPNYSPESKSGLEKIVAIADGSQPLREALERYKNEQGHYPFMITNLFPAYLQPTNAPEDWLVKDWGEWEYQVETTNSYKLFFQLCWDGGLYCDHSAFGTNHWSWDVGSGAVDLTQKIEKRR